MSSEPAREFLHARDRFLEIADLPPADQRARLESLRADDTGLARAVEALLRADSEAGEFLEAPAAAWLPALADTAAGEPLTETGQTIGAYRTLALLGHGGMGEVFLAERTDGQFEQRVALKVLKRGLDSSEILARFLRERQILARLDHPNIARLFDGGLAADGRPFFALEHVDGEPITEYCRKRSLAIDEISRLVALCCDAVDAAHRSLVVHRDLKPSNILVTSAGQVKLLDFGIAKLLAEDDDASRTRSEVRVLTPDYAAPEQILGEPVTTATDVYALGLVLYELLTGHLPHERRVRTLSKLVSRVEQDAPQRPSAILKKSSGARTMRALQGDLDTIVLKALQRDPARRYPSAAALGEDLRRYLQGLPVHARPDTLSYRAGKFVRRHRAGVIAAALVAVSLLAGLAAAAWQAQRASAQARRAERVIEVLVGIFESADPDTSPGRDLSATEILEQGVSRIERDLDDEPEVQADLFEALSRIKHSLGEYAKARSLAERAVTLHGGPAVADSAAGLAAWGSAELALSRFDEAAAVLQQAIAHFERRGNPDDISLSRARSSYANVLYMQGKIAEAEVMERAVYETSRRLHGDDHRDTAEHLRNLGVLLTDLERYDEAEDAHRRALQALERQLGPEHPSVAVSHFNLAVLYDNRRKDSEAETHYRRSLEIRKKVLGDEHPQVGQSCQLLSQFLARTGRLDEAAAVAEEGLAIWKAIDPEHNEVAKLLNELSVIDEKRARFADAETKMREVLRIQEKLLGPHHVHTAQSFVNLSYVVASQGRLDEAESLLRTSLARLEEAPEPKASYVTWAKENLAEVLRWRGDAREAARLQREVLAWAGGTYGAEDLRSVAPRLQLAQALAAAGEASEARTVIDEALARYEALAPGTRAQAEAMQASARVALAAGDFARAERELTEAMPRLEKKFGRGHWRFAEARGLLGLALLGLDRAAEGQPLVDEARQHLAAVLGPDDPRTRSFVPVR